MLKALPATALLILVAFAITWGTVKFIAWAPRSRRERRLAKAEQKAVWKVYRRANGAGFWEIGVQRRWKDVTLQEIPTTPVMSMPVTASLEELLEAEGQATMVAGRMNEAP